MRIPLAFAALLLVSGTAARADESIEDKLRETLRHVTVDLRAAQDNGAALQAQLDQTRKQRDLLQQQVTDLQAKLAQAQAQPAAPPPQAGPSAEDMAKLQAELDDAQKQIASLQGGLARSQGAYQQAAAQAAQKDALSRQLDAKGQASAQMLAACSAKNGKLIILAEDILHMYETQDFRTLLLNSREPLLGYYKVALENLVQDKDDLIQDQRYRPGERPASAQPGAPQ